MNNYIKIQALLSFLKIFQKRTQDKQYDTINFINIENTFTFIQYQQCYQNFIQSDFCVKDKIGLFRKVQFCLNKLSSNRMFSQNNKYYINESQQNVFDLQLPSSSIKIPFKKQRQHKILKINQRKLQLQTLKQSIYMKCKLEELQYLDYLDKEKQKILKFKENQKINKQKQKQILKQQFINKNKSFKLQNLSNSHYEKQSILSNQSFFKDSVDQIINVSFRQSRKNRAHSEINNIKNQQKFINNPKSSRLAFSLQPTLQKKAEQKEQLLWVQRVMEGRKKMQIKEQEQNSDSDEDS